MEGRRLSDEDRDRCKRRLERGAYYYVFGGTGVEAIDLILGAVSAAGKGYHHTDGWGDPGSCDAGSYIDIIEIAAEEAAALLRSQAEEIERLRSQLETPTHYWSDDANCMEYAIEWGDFYLLEDSVALEPGAHADFEVTPLIVLPGRKVRVRRTADGEYESEALTERSKS